MIAINTKQQTPTEGSALLLSQKSKEPAHSFSSFLNAVEVPRAEKKTSSKGLFLALDKGDAHSLSKDKKSGIASLLKMQKSEEPKGMNDFVELNPKLTASMDISALKTIMVKAKQYIKSQIIESKGFKKQEIASLPKTLKGLVQVAKKIGIDISKITIEKVAEMPQTKAFRGHKLPVPIANENRDFTNNGIALKEGKTPLFKTEKNREITTQENPKLKTAIAQTTNSNVIEKDFKATTKAEHTHSTMKMQEKSSLKQETPLFKTEKNREITTQELVSVKSLQNNKTISKEKNSAQNLELLLQGKKVSHKATIKRHLTADFSITTAKVVAPKMDRNGIETLETVLHKSKDEKLESQNKTEMPPIIKSESFEVKIHEAKQMVKYLSHDVKNAIEEYKSPFTRLKVELHPQKLGKIELTIVERGKKLHINLSSNNTALNTLAMNVNDLKLQLNNNGINNATFNFNSNTQSDSFQSGQQQQQQQQKEQARNEYSYTQTQERGEEILSSLEIIVPHYA